MPAAKPIRRYNRFQHALLLMRHYGKSRIGVPLTAFALLIISVIIGLLLITIFSYVLACILNHLFFGRFAFELIFYRVWVPCAIISGSLGRIYWDDKVDEWDVKLRAAMTSPPPDAINETLPESDLLVRASNSSNDAARTVLLRPASKILLDDAPQTLLRPSSKDARHLSTSKSIENPPQK